MTEAVRRAGLSMTELDAVRALADTVNQHDGLALKLNWEMRGIETSGVTNNFLSYDGSRLVGFAGLDGFGAELEFCGMVHPSHRRRGIGQKLLRAVRDESRIRGAQQLLLVCEHASASGRAFVDAQSDGARYESSEYRLEFHADGSSPSVALGVVTLRLATQSDVPVLATIRAASFGDPSDMVQQEVEHALAEQGSRVFLATVAEEPIGTVGVVLEDEGAYIRALAVFPELQGRGYGRAILGGLVSLLLEEGQSHLALDVATSNRNALTLYLSCGFIETNRFDYFAVSVS